VIPILETRRLSLRPLNLSDVDAVQQVFPRFEIVQFMSRMIPWPYPADGALTFIRDVAIPKMEEGTAWHWSIRPVEAPDRLIGIISLMDEPDNNRGFWPSNGIATLATFFLGRSSRRHLVNLMRSICGTRFSCRRHRKLRFSPHLR
jgi:hypothetical protein